MNKVITCVCLGLCPYFMSVFRGNAQDAISEFANEILHTDNNERLFVASGPTGQARGGYLYRFYLDVTGDNKPEIFLSSSLDAVREENVWAVYQQKPEGVVQLASRLNLGTDFYVANNGKLVTLQNLLSSRHNPDHLLSYSFDGKGNLTVSEKVIMESDIPQWVQGEQDYNTFLGLGKKVTPIIEKILLAEYLKYPASKWKPIDRNNDLERQQNDPNDVQALNQFKDFRLPGVPLAATSQSPPSQPNPVQTASTFAPPAAVLATSPVPMAAATVQPSFPWLPLVLLAIAASGFGLWKFRQR